MTNPSTTREMLGRAPWALPLLVALLPCGVVLADVLTYAGPTSLPEFVQASIFSGIGLRTLIAGVGAGVLAALVGLAPGWALASAPRGWRLVLCALWLSGLALPAVFLGGVWSHLLGLGPSPPRSDEADLLRWLALVFSWALSLAPLSSLIVMFGLQRVPRGELHAARLYLSRAKSWRIVLWPRLRGGLLLAAAATAALAFNDAGTPAHFGVQTVASRASFEFLSSLQTAPAGASVLPAWLLAGGLILLLANGGLGRGVEGARLRTPPMLWVMIATLLSLSVLVPAISLAITAGDSIAITRYLPEIGNSLEYSILGGLTAAALGLLALALESATGPGRGRRMLLAAGALALSAPGMAVGYTALIAQIELGGSQAVWWWAGFLLLRCAPWCLPLIVFAGGLSTQRSALALGLPLRSRIKATLLDRGPALALACMMAGAAGALREHEYFAAFGLPGGESLAARSAQLLHFGMRPALAALMLLQLGLGVGWGLLCLGLWRRRG